MNKISVDQAKELFKAMINNHKMELDYQGFSPSEIYELQEFTKIYREGLNEYEDLLTEINKITKS